MCGRFTLKTAPDQWGQLLLPIIDTSRVIADWQPRLNIAPTQSVICVQYEPQSAKLAAAYLRWGLIPPWADKLAIGSRMINARSETLAEKRSFRKPLEHRRCAIMADGYYEWRQEGKSKQAYWLHRPDEAVFAMAGLWETNTKVTGEPVRTCTIITIGASQAISAIHDRMPVILVGEALSAWLQPDQPLEVAQSLLKPAADDFLQTQQVKLTSAR